MFTYEYTLFSEVYIKNLLLRVKPCILGTNFEHKKNQGVFEMKSNKTQLEQVLLFSFFSILPLLSVDVAFAAATKPGVQQSSAADQAMAAQLENANSPQNSQQRPPAQQETEVRTLAMGTKDGGGANSINGKLIEEYLHPISSEPAYKQSVRPLLAVLNAKLKPAAEPGNLQIGSQDWWKSELQDLFAASQKDLTWYFISGKLKQLTEPVTGIPFPSDQVAVQTAAGEVWVDEDLFRSKKLKPDELLALQASTIVHEIVLRASIKQDVYLAYQFHHEYHGLRTQGQIMKQVRLTNYYILHELDQVSPADFFDGMISLQWFNFGDPVYPQPQ